jgi:hypothetical protein
MDDGRWIDDGSIDGRLDGSGASVVARSSLAAIDRGAGGASARRVPRIGRGDARDARGRGTAARRAAAPSSSANLFRRPRWRADEEKKPAPAARARAGRVAARGRDAIARVRCERERTVVKTVMAAMFDA